MSTAEAIESLTDVALFITVYVSLIATVFGLGEPRTRGEEMGRVLAFWTCGVIGVLVALWLLAALLIRVGIIATVQ